MGKRFVAEFQVYQPEPTIQFLIRDYFQKEGFVQTQYQGELVWKKGVGVLTAPQFMRVMYNRGWIRLEAWLKYAILPGVYCGEMGLDGFFGFAIKEQLKSRVFALMALLKQPYYPQGEMAASSAEVQQSFSSPQNVSEQSGNIQQYSNPPVSQPIMVHNPKKQATASLVLGLVGIVAWILPIVGIILTIVGIITGIQGMKSTAKNRATAGLILSIVFLVISSVALIFNVLYAAVPLLTA